MRAWRQKAIDLKKFPCETCQKLFAVKCHLTAHIQTVHEKSRSFLCHECAQTFHHVALLLLHLRRRHPKAKPKASRRSFLAADDDDEPVTRDRDVNFYRNALHSRLLRIHTCSSESNQIEIHCELCKEKFEKFSILEAHLLTSHENIRPFACKMCDKSYRSKEAYKAHSANHTGSSEAKFQCELCARFFARKLSLLTHQATAHSDTRPFSCTSCEKAYKSKHDLGIHVKHAHEDVQDYDCSFCRKSFHSKIVLEMHGKIHTGVGLFECPQMSCKVPPKECLGHTFTISQREETISVQTPPSCVHHQHPAKNSRS